jgi:hypothetical protein
MHKSAVVFAFLQSRLGKLSDRVGRRPPVAAGLFISGLSSAIVPNLTVLMTWIGQLVLLPLSGFWTAEAIGFSAATPAEQALVADLSDAKTRGRSFGVSPRRSVSDRGGWKWAVFGRDIAARLSTSNIVLWARGHLDMFIHEPRAVSPPLSTLPRAASPVAQRWRQVTSASPRKRSSRPIQSPISFSVCRCGRRASRRRKPCAGAAPAVGGAASS